MTDYPIHLDTQSSKGTVCSKKDYRYKWTWQTPIHLDTQSSKGTVCSKKDYGYKWTWQTIQYT